MTSKGASMTGTLVGGGGIAGLTVHSQSGNQEENKQQDSKGTPVSVPASKPSISVPAENETIEQALERESRGKSYGKPISKIGGGFDAEWWPRVHARHYFENESQEKIKGGGTRKTWIGRREISSDDLEKECRSIVKKLNNKDNKEDYEKAKEWCVTYDGIFSSSEYKNKGIDFDLYGHGKSAKWESAYDAFVFDESIDSRDKETLGSLKGYWGNKYAALKDFCEAAFNLPINKLEEFKKCRCLIINKPGR